MLRAGDHVVVTDNTYGGTFRLFDKILTRYKLEFSYVDTSQPQLIEQALRPSTKMLFVETPTNPVMRLTDIAVARAIAQVTERRWLSTTPLPARSCSGPSRWAPTSSSTARPST